jgi:serine-type D-Ala-D-Ala carboxypeptidase/endopeptidase (penicillin-binding protein 4)
MLPENKPKQCGTMKYLKRHNTYNTVTPKPFSVLQAGFRLMKSCFKYAVQHTRSVFAPLLLTLAAIIAFTSMATYAQTSAVYNALSTPPIQTWLAEAHISSTATGIAIAPADGGKTIASLNADLALNPASVMKLYTTYAALELLGPAYAWKTHILSNGRLHQGVLTGDVWVKGSGDPSLKTQDVWRLLRELRLAGVQHIAGNWVLDRSVFADDPHSPYSFDGDGERPYNVQPDGLLMSFNATRLLFKPITSNKGEAAWQFIADPLPLGWQQSGHVSATSGDCNDWRSRLSHTITAHSDDANNANKNNNGGLIKVSGSIPTSCGQQELYRAIVPAQSYSAGLIATLWQELGGTYAGSFTSGITPKEARVLAQVESDPLSTIIRDINKRSNNVMARMLYLNLGYAGQTQTQPANKASSEKRLRDWLVHAKLDSSTLVFDNGSGLSRHERSSAAHLVQLLQYAYTHPMMPEFMSSLAVASQDGTVVKRMSGVAGAAHLKTGTLKDSAALAGYVLGASGRRYVLAGIINHGDTTAARGVLDKLVVWLQTNG